MATNRLLIFGGLMSSLAALLHIAIIIGGPEWYRYFGAGEEMANLAAQGSWLATIQTLGIFAILSIWGIYAFSGAGLIRKLPFLRTALIIISAIYLIRGLALIPVWLFKPDHIGFLHIWSSILSFAIGAFYAAGTRQVWRKISLR